MAIICLNVDDQLIISELLSDLNTIYKNKGGQLDLGGLPITEDVLSFLKRDALANGTIVVPAPHLEKEGILLYKEVPPENMQAAKVLVDSYEIKYSQQVVSVVKTVSGDLEVRLSARRPKMSLANTFFKTVDEDGNEEDGVFVIASTIQNAIEKATEAFSKVVQS